MGNVPTKRRESLINCADLFGNVTSTEKADKKKTFGERLFLMTGEPPKIDFITFLLGSPILCSVTPFNADGN